MRGIDTGKVCADGNDAFGGIKSCLGSEGCAQSSDGCTYYWLLIACGFYRLTLLEGYVHGGVNVGLDLRETV